MSEIEELRARVAELEAEVLEQCRLNGMGSEREACALGKVAAQALTIKTLKSKLSDAMWWNWRDADIYDYCDVQSFNEALALPDNSTEVLQEWLDKKLGEPVAWESSRNGFICKENKNPEYNNALYRKPEIK